MNLEWHKYVNIWTIHSIFYSFTFTLSTTLYQAYAIRILGYNVDDLGNIVFAGFAAIALGNISAVLLLNRYRHRRIFLWKIFTSISIISWALIGFLDIASQYLLIVLLVIAQATGAIGGLAYSDFIADFIPMEKSIKIFSRINIFTLIASLISLIASLVIFISFGISVIGYRLCYLLALFSSICSSIFLWMMKDIVLRQNQKLLVREISRKYMYIFMNNKCKGYIIVNMIFTFSVNLPAALWNYCIIRIFNGSELWISINTITNTLANALGNYILNKISYRLNPKKTMEYSILLISFIPLIFMISPTLEKQIILNMYSGLSWAGFNLMVNIYNLYLTREDRMYLVSTIGILTNLGASLASRTGSAIASIGLTAIRLIFIISTIGRITSYIYAKKNLSNI